MNIQELLPSLLSALEALIITTPCDWSITHLRNSIAQKDTILCAILNNGLVGFVCVRKSKFSWEILQLLVTLPCRRQHVATALLQRVIHEAQQNNIESVQLEVRRSNQPAIALYQTLGFEINGVRVRYYRDGEDAILMGYHDKH